MLYGFERGNRYEREEGEHGDILVMSKIPERFETLKKKSFKLDVYKQDIDPEGKVLRRYWDIVPWDEQEDPALPQNYPGYYYWVWYNGAFFEVRGETEKYVLVEVGEWRFDQADALGIKREDVISERYKPAKIGSWWLRKDEVKMPDEFGKGKYVYMRLMGEFGEGEGYVHEIVKRDGNYIRVRGRYVKRKYRIDNQYKKIKEKIDINEFPMGHIYPSIIENEEKVRIMEDMNEEGDGEVWRPSEDEILFEATFDVRKLRKLRSMSDGVWHDFYLYGEEEVPYRL